MGSIVVTMDKTTNSTNIHTWPAGPTSQVVAVYCIHGQLTGHIVGRPQRENK